MKKKIKKLQRDMGFQLGLLTSVAASCWADSMASTWLFPIIIYSNMIGACWLFEQFLNWRLILAKKVS